MSRETLDALGLTDIRGGSVDVDILIGEPDCIGRRYGPRALGFLVEALRGDPTVPPVGLSPSVENVAARRAYAKAGFRQLREHNAPGFGRCALMLMPLDGGR